MNMSKNAVEKLKKKYGATKFFIIDRDDTMVIIKEIIDSFDMSEDDKQDMYQELVRLKLSDRMNLIRRMVPKRLTLNLDTLLTRKESG